MNLCSSKSKKADKNKNNKIKNFCFYLKSSKSNIPHCLHYKPKSKSNVAGRDGSIPISTELWFISLA